MERQRLRPLVDEFDGTLRDLAAVSRRIKRALRVTGIDVLRSKHISRPGSAMNDTISQPRARPVRRRI